MIQIYDVTYRLKMSKAVVILGVLFLFALGVQAGFLLEFMESERRFENNRHSLEETANDLIPH